MQTPFHLSCFPWFQVQDNWRHHNIRYVIYLGLSICRRMVDLAAADSLVQLEKDQVFAMEQTLRSIWRQWSREFGDALEWRPCCNALQDTLGSRDQVNSEMPFKVIRKQEWRRIASADSYKLGCQNHERLAIHLAAVIEGHWKYSLSLLLSELGVEVGGHSIANWEVVIKEDWRYTWMVR